MAHVLTNTKKKRNTIREELHGYLHQIFFIVIFMIVFTVCFFVLSMFHMQQETDRIYLVNDFYTELQAEQELLYQYTLKQDVLMEERLDDGMEKLQEALKGLLVLEVSTTFRRDVLDLIGVQENYCGKVEEIRGLIASGSKIQQINEAYYTARNMHDIMYDTFQNLYQQVLEKSRETAKRSWMYFFCFVGMLVLTLFLLIRYLLFQIQNTEEKIASPIQHLAKDVQKIDLLHLDAGDDLAELSDVGANEEVTLLIEKYNAMLDKIKRQLEEREEYHRTELKLREQEVLQLQTSNELKKSQLMNLQMQINPHFLFNTLTMISHTAYLAKDRETVELLDITSELLRYVLDYSDKAVTLGKEMEELGNYIYLLEKRFGRRISFLFDLDESFHDVLIPNMILQPLLENAIVHGVWMYTEGGRILIRTFYDEEQGIGNICIVDNGEGVSKQEAKRIEQEMKSNQIATGKIGLCNVAFRLNIFFQGNARMYFRSMPGEETEVRIEIPCERRTERVSDCDC